MSPQARSLVALAVLALLASAGRAAEPARKSGPTPGSFTIESFKLESGVTLPRAVVVYGTYGTLDAAKDNAVLLPSHYMAKSDGYDWLIGDGRALPSLWGHPAGAGASPEDLAFIERKLRAFLAAR